MGVLGSAKRNWRTDHCVFALAPSPRAVEIGARTLTLQKYTLKADDLVVSTAAFLALSEWRLVQGSTAGVWGGAD